MITVSELKFNFNALATENLYLAVDKILRLGRGWEPPICGSIMFEQQLTTTWHKYAKMAETNTNASPNLIVSASGSEFENPIEMKCEKQSKQIQFSSSPNLIVKKKHSQTFSEFSGTL